MLARSLAVLIAALALAPSASAAAAPRSLHGFLLRATESVASPHAFARTPSFAWTRVRGAARYEFQLATSKRFSENSIVWERASLKAPLTTVPITLPWMSGAPYSWYARVRAYVGFRVTRWSRPYGFDLRAPAAPTSLSGGPLNPRPGMVRWTPVEGATGYQFIFLYDQDSGDNRTWSTATNAADLREFYAFHNDVASNPLGFTPVRWRARAVRVVTGKPANRIPVVSYGRWSAINTTIEPDLDTSSQIALGGTISRTGSSSVVSTASVAATPHAIMPGFWWSGALGLNGKGACPNKPNDPIAGTGVTCPLFHVYVYLDRACVNRVYTSDLVGSPAFVPRLDRTLDLPKSEQGLRDTTNVVLGNEAKQGEGLVYGSGNEKVYAAGTGPGIDATKQRESGLWDSDFGTGRYWWTVVPAVPHLNTAGKIEYRDVEFPQDKCEAGVRQGFRKTSKAVTRGASGVPYVSGQTLAGAVRTATTARPAFFGRVIVAWKPVPSARTYEIQWSRKVAPWRTVGKVVTAATSSQLTLGTGVWRYRVRGLDPTIPGPAKGMTWSSPQYLRVLPRTFTIG